MKRINMLQFFITLALLLFLSSWEVVEVDARVELNDVSRDTTKEATLTLNGFEKGQDGGGPAACDGSFHDNDELIVALPTKFFERGKRCGKKIVIEGNGHAVSAKVVDECGKGCDDNIVDGSAAVWKGLEVEEKDWGELIVTWHDDV